MGQARLRAVLVLGLALVVALSLAVTGLQHRADPGDRGPASLAAATDACTDVLLYAVPGNGQGTGTSPTGFGRVARNFVRQYERGATAAGRTVDSQVLDFATSPISALRPAHHQHGAASRYVTRRMVNDWRRGVKGAGHRLVDQLVAARATCPQQTLVLVGYAQGAMAVHRALLQLRGQHNMLVRLAAAVLVSDGSRTPGNRAKLRGKPRAPRSARGLDTVRVKRIGDAAPGRLRGHVMSVCRTGDVVCDLTRISVSRAIHRARSYTWGHNADQVGAAGRWAWLRTSQVPVVPDVPDVRGRVGSRLDARLPVDVRSQDRDDLRWEATSALPGGVILNKHGRLVGVPTAEGTWTVDFTVRNTAVPGYQYPARGSVRISVDPGTARGIAAGGTSACQVTTDSLLYCWGSNAYGELGDGTRTNRSVPTRVRGKIWSQVNTGGSHTCGIKDNQRLFCWGLNNFGQVGDGTRTTRVYPALVSKQAWIEVSAGWNSTCGIKANHRLFCWGLNKSGALGTGNTHRHKHPVRIGNAANWTTVSTDGDHTCGTRSDGTAWCWGANDFGQLGDGTRKTRLNPTRVGNATTWARISVGWLHSCGFTATGWGLCWGFNGNGQLGDGTRRTRLNPTNLAVPRTWVGITAGDGFSCGRQADGTAWCWGDDATGQLGAPGGGINDTPQQVAGGGQWTGLATGFSHACGLAADGRTMCWGANDSGQIGNGTSVPSFLPAEVHLP